MQTRFLIGGVALFLLTAVIFLRVGSDDSDVVSGSPARAPTDSYGAVMTEDGSVHGKDTISITRKPRNNDGVAPAEGEIYKRASGAGAFVDLGNNVANEVSDQIDNEITTLRDVPTASPTSSVGKAKSDEIVSEDTDAPLLTPEEVQALGGETSDDRVVPDDRGQIGGVRNPRPSRGVSISDGAQSSSSGSSSSEPSFTRVTGQPRGYTMLYLMHPGARQTVERQLDAMLRSNVGELYLGVLTDGTFEQDFAYLADVVKRIGEESRALTLVLYLSNGATMRRFETTPIVAGFNRIDPIQFRALIRFDQGIREEFLQMARAVRPVLEARRLFSPTGRNIVIPMLEDNLDADSYLAMRDLARSVLGDVSTFVRNPCPNCGVEGSDVFSFGDGLEIHPPLEGFVVTSEDGVTLDGTGYYFDGESPGLAISVEETKALALQTFESSALYFGLWRAGRQGLFGGPDVHPDERIYEVPTDEQLEQEIEILRHGLFEER